MRAISVVLLLAAPLAFAQSHRDSTAAQPDASGALPGDDALTCEQLQTQLNSMASDPALQSLMAQQQTLAGGTAGQVAQHPELAQGNADQLRRLGGSDGASAADSLGRLGAGAGPTSSSDAGTGAPAPGQASTPAAEAPQGEQPGQGRKKHGFFKGVGKALGGGIGGGFGADRAAVAAQQRQIEAMGKAGRDAQAANKATLDAQATQVNGMSPQLMRGMHLMQIAQAKGCAARQSSSGH
jgi:hypothetical protein